MRTVILTEASPSEEFGATTEGDRPLLAGGTWGGASVRIEYNMPSKGWQPIGTTLTESSPSDALLMLAGNHRAVLVGATASTDLEVVLQ